MANMELIETKTVGSGGAANVEFTSIPSTYTDLLIKASTRGASGGDFFTHLNLTFNSSTSGYTFRRITGNGSTAASSSDGASSSMFIKYGIDGSAATASTFGNLEIYIPNYTSSNHKSVSVDAVAENNNNESWMTMFAGLWSNTASITSLKLEASYISGVNLVEGSTVSLYGISAVTSTPKATGGIVSQDATYWYHMFPFTSTFTPTAALTNVDYLVIAGGGAGGVNNAGGGGGGAGGLRSTVGATGGGGSLESKISLNSGTAYAITVGAGGASVANTTYNSTRNNGSDSSIAGTGLTTITSVGGGGGSGGNLNGANGGSGGGADGGYALSGGSASPSGQGYAGGNGSTTPYYVGGGGGGAGAVGNNGNTNVAKGGDGVAISAVANATFTGVNTYYAGGGNGGGENPAIVSTPGSLGGGGAGGRDGNGGTGDGTNGVVNTGSGGGGAEWESGASAVSGAGGSGLVVLRYAK